MPSDDDPVTISHPYDLYTISFVYSHSPSFLYSQSIRSLYPDTADRVMDPEATRASISLVDNTAPPDPDQYDQLPRVDTNLSRTSSSRRWSRPSVRGELTKRKYAKWQPHRLGLDDGNAAGTGSGSASGLSDDEMQSDGLRQSSTALSSGRSSGAGGAGGVAEGSMSPSRVVDFASDGEDNSTAANALQQQAQDQQQQQPPKSTSELDILYENQRGWFLFGIPLYSHSSLLNFDPSAWATREMHDSPVNITNAQLPDPSWQWAWHSWYVDMSGDVDEQGWQYSSSFSSSAWHGSHPWFHSFVRRRRWVRLRTKRLSSRVHRGRSNFEEAHMLTADYFTIHSRRKRANTVENGSRAPSTYLMDPANQMVDEEPYLEEIGNIPTLMYALKKAIVDREKIDALKRFIEEGGDEIYYLEDRVRLFYLPVYRLSWAG